MSDLLWPHQREVLSRIKDGCILYGMPGSGKSLVAAAYAVEKITRRPFEEGGRAPVASDLYIITTAMKRDSLDWEKELANFGLRSDKRCRNIRFHVDSWNNIKKYRDVKGAYFIFDEQRVIGKGAWASAFKRIARHNRWILLSGTPGDTWMDYMQVFIANGFYKNQRDFVDQHVEYEPYTTFPRIKRYHNQRKLQRYRDRILIEMPMKRETTRREQVIYCTYDELLYEQVEKGRWNPWEQRPVRNASEACYSLRKVVSSVGSSRPEAVRKILKGYHRAIVFYNYDYELEALRGVCEGLAIPYGERNGHKHDPLPEGAEWAYLVQYSSGAEAWNCVTTDTMIFYSQSYSWKVMEQARGRIDRANTSYKTLLYFTLTSHASIDLAVQKALERKEIFNEKGFWKA